MLLVDAPEELPVLLGAEEAEGEPDASVEFSRVPSIWMVSVPLTLPVAYLPWGRFERN